MHVAGLPCIQQHVATGCKDDWFCAPQHSLMLAAPIMSIGAGAEAQEGSAYAASKHGQARRARAAGEAAPPRRGAPPRGAPEDLFEGLDRILSGPAGAHSP